MSRIATPALDTATGATPEVYAQIKKMAGSVPNTFAAIGALAPEALKSVLATEGVLAAGTLGKKDLETIKLIVSVVAGCDYCVAAHSLLGKLAGLSPDTRAPCQGRGWLCGCGAEGAGGMGWLSGDGLAIGSAQSATHTS